MSGGSCDGVLDGRGEVAVAGRPALEGEAEAVGGGAARASVQLRVVGLGEVDEPAVVAEVDRQQLGMAVEAEAGDDDRVELAGQEVGQVERAELLVLQRGVGGRAGVELVAVGAADALDALAREVRRRACRPCRSRRRRRRSGRQPAVRARGPSRPWPRPPSAIRSGRMWSRASTPSTRTPGMPAVSGEQLARERAAADDDEPRRCGSCRWPEPQAALARRSSMSRRAVSAATPASRQ